MRTYKSIQSEWESGGHDDEHASEKTESDDRLHLSSSIALGSLLSVEPVMDVERRTVMKLWLNVQVDLLFIIPKVDTSRAVNN